MNFTGIVVKKITIFSSANFFMQIFVFINCSIIYLKNQGIDRSHGQTCILYVFMADLPTAYMAFGQKMGIHNMIYGKEN